MQAANSVVGSAPASLWHSSTFVFTSASPKVVDLKRCIIKMWFSIDCNVCYNFTVFTISFCLQRLTFSADSSDWDKRLQGTEVFGKAVSYPWTDNRLCSFRAYKYWKREENNLQKTNTPETILFVHILGDKKPRAVFHKHNFELNILMFLIKIETNWLLDL